MKIKLVMMCALAAILFCLSACSPSSRQVSVAVSCDDFMTGKHISKEVEAAVNGSLEITLCSNPTTGFLWSESAQISDRSVLQQTDHRSVPPEQGALGAAGKEVWTFDVLKEGKSTVSMEYSRPWEGGEKGEWTFTLTVTAR